MAGVRLPEDLENRLTALATKTHRPKSYYLKEALQAYLDEYEEDLKTVADYEEQLKKGTLKTYSLEEVMKKHGLE